MNYKKLKKIILNLLKFVHFSLGTITDLLIKIEDIVIDLMIKLEGKRLKSPISIYKEEDYIGDSYIEEHIKDKRMLD